MIISFLKGRIVLKCNRSRISRARKRKFSPGTLQQPGTFIQEAHSASSTKNLSRSSYKKRTSINKSCEILDPNRKRNKVDTVRPVCIDQCCSFAIQIICDKTNNKWYIRHNDTKTNIHSGHLPIHPQHVQTSIRNIDASVKEYMYQLFSEHVDQQTIISCVAKRFKINLSYDTVRYHNRCRLLHKINIVSSQPYGTAVDQLLASFKNSTDVSYLYVTHCFNSGFVTHYCGRKKQSKSTNDDSILVYQDEVENWRKLLKISDGA